MCESVLAAYGLSPKQVKLERIGTGLINHTWKVCMGDQVYILQKVNGDVFSSPPDIAHNTELVAAYLQQHCPEYNFVAPLSCPQGRS